MIYKLPFCKREYLERLALETQVTTAAALCDAAYNLLSQAQTDGVSFDRERELLEYLEHAENLEASARRELARFHARSTSAARNAHSIEASLWNVVPAPKRREIESLVAVCGH